MNQASVQPLRACLYIRESTDRQDLSPEVQESQLRLYCELRGLDITEIVHDVATSAAKPFQTRPAAGRLHAMIGRGEVDAVVALKLDRMFRDVVDCLTNVDVWDKRGVALHLLDMGGNAVDTRSSAGRFMLTVLAAAAEMERNRIGERTREALAVKRKRKEVYGPIPFGYVRIGDRLAPHAQQQLTLGMAVSMRKGGKSYAAIAEALIRANRATARGGRWRANTVRGILNNEVHAA